MNTITETEYLTETKFRNAVKKVLGPIVNSKADTDRYSRFGVNVVNAEGHWKKEATHFWVKTASSELHWDLIDIERSLVLAGFEMVEYNGDYLDDSRVTIAWRKAAN